MSNASERSPGRFAGRTAIVIGAGSGIGRATAVRLAREGARVVAADISADRLEQLTGEFPDLDQVDALANVAGIMDAFLPPAEIDDATWERVFAVNVTAPMRLTRAVLPRMLEAGGGAIVNGLTKSTAVFYKGNGILANAVAPGPVATAEQLAATITWLLSDDASNVNGVVLPSDGGWSAI